MVSHGIKLGDGRQPMYKSKETIRDLLQKEPIGQRFNSFKKHNLEFTSYLRPVLREEIFDEENEGWSFVATHVQQNNQMFHEVLKERRRQSAIIQ